MTAGASSESSPSEGVESVSAAASIFAFATCVSIFALAATFAADLAAIFALFALIVSAAIPAFLAASVIAAFLVAFASTLADLAEALAAPTAAGDALSSSLSLPVGVYASSSESLSGAFLCFANHDLFILIKLLKSVTFSKSETIPSITGSNP